MKTSVALLFLSLLVMMSCSSTSQSPQTAATMGRGDTTYVDNPQTLADVLIREPGVSFQSGQITVRGQAYPLFIVDGVPVGRTYGDAVSTVRIEDVRSVEVLKSASETAIYGRRGANGVILINTR